MKLNKTTIAFVVTAVVFLGLGLALKTPVLVSGHPVVLVGPIDPSLNTVGPINKGMNRKYLLSLLGTPLRARDPGTTGAWFDPVLFDYFDGMYARVNYTTTDTIRDVQFALGEAARRNGIDLRVVVRLPDLDVVLSRDFSWSDAQTLVSNKKFAPPPAQLYMGDHTITVVYPGDRTLSLYFSVDDHSLNHIRYAFGK